MYQDPEPTEPLAQGDIFRGHFAFSFLKDPSQELHIARNGVTVPSSQVEDAWGSGSEVVLFSAFYSKWAVILSQTCDLTPQRQQQFVTVGAIIPIEGIQAGAARESCRKNRQTRFHYLAEHLESELNESLVSFERLTLVEREGLENSRELRVLTLPSPYRENLSHRFGEFISRVALP